MTGKPRRVAMLLALCGAALGGCDKFERYEAHDTERLLATAGFERLPLQDPAGLRAHYAYVYADPQYCGCLYVGDAGAYAEYLKLEGEEIGRSMTWDDY